MIVHENQRFMAQRMKARVRAHPVDHTPLVTAPSVVVDVIREAMAEVVAVCRWATCTAAGEGQVKNLMASGRAGLMIAATASPVATRASERLRAWL